MSGPLFPKLFLILVYVVMLLCLKKNLAAQVNNIGDKNTYIVQCNKNCLPSNQQNVLYAYQHVLTGFAAKLTATQVEEMKGQEGIVHVRPEKILSLQTTHSPEFLGLRLNSGVWSDSNLGKGIIIGVLDSGIKPDHPSFSDEGMSPPPAKWRGNCDFQKGICNKKLIGARNFITNEGGLPPLDTVGHGTLMASIAAGNFVKNAGVFGNAAGTASGVAPYAHLAIYKVCDEVGCPETAVLAAIDTAIEDGVDIIALSLGGDSARYSESLLSVGTFAAIQRGMFVSAPAGNGGPTVSSLINEAPWLLTVGASTMDRKFVGNVKLGNGEEYDGESLFDPKDSCLPLSPVIYTGLCAEGSLSTDEFKGKIVLCEMTDQTLGTQQAKEVADDGGIGMILMNKLIDDFSVAAEHYAIPATRVSYEVGKKIKEYIDNNTDATATFLFKGTVIGDKLAPALASFSGRGPNEQSLFISKPDIIAPGVEILGAWSSSVDNNTNSNGNATFNVMSGTSLSASHLSGVAALIKSCHPDWSPAAIKSAMMTTADSVNLLGKPIVDEIFTPADQSDIGSGHINPSKAIDPGLVYDIAPDDYISFLCGLGYDNDEVSIIAQRETKCSEIKIFKQEELNYPSFSLSLGMEPSTETYTKTLTNVGPASSKYTATVEVKGPSVLTVKVNPSIITFTDTNQKVSFSVEFCLPNTTDVLSVDGFLKWTSDMHTVTSPIYVDLFRQLPQDDFAS